jgi:REP element-mobilizing transposase RayT
LRYFITFTCYGARLHGDESGSVDRRQNLVGSRLLAPDAKRVMAERRAMLQYPYVLDEADRAVVLVAIRKHCAHRGWNLLAAHIGSNHVHTIVRTHVHTIVDAEARPERIRNEFQSYASRELNRTRSETLGAAWKHPLAVEGPGPQAGS